MSTTTTTVTTTPATGFWATLKSLIPAIELAGNVAVTLLVPGGAALSGLLTGLENAVNPLLQSIGNPQSVSSTILNVYATIIGVLTTLEQTPGLPAGTLATITAYIQAAENGTAAYIQAQAGFNPANYNPVTPIP
jgi:hypothetical protein